MKAYIIAIVTIIIIVSAVLLLQPGEQETIILQQDVTGEAYSSLFQKSYNNGETQETYESEIWDE
jgi:hypothetical protein